MSAFFSAMDYLSYAPSLGLLRFAEMRVGLKTLPFFIAAEVVGAGASSNEDGTGKVLVFWLCLSLSTFSKSLTSSLW